MSICHNKTLPELKDICTDLYVLFFKGLFLMTVSRFCESLRQRPSWTLRCVQEVIHLLTFLQFSFRIHWDLFKLLLTMATDQVSLNLCLWGSLIFSLLNFSHVGVGSHFPNFISLMIQNQPVKYLVQTCSSNGQLQEWLKMLVSVAVIATVTTYGNIFYVTGLTCPHGLLFTQRHV